MNKYYVQGFIAKCAEHGVDPKVLVKQAGLAGDTLSAILAGKGYTGGHYHIGDDWPWIPAKHTPDVAPLRQELARRLRLNKSYVVTPTGRRSMPLHTADELAQVIADRVRESGLGSSSRSTRSSDFHTQLRKNLAKAIELEYPAHVVSAPKTVPVSKRVLQLGKLPKYFASAI